MLSDDQRNRALLNVGLATLIVALWAGLVTVGLPTWATIVLLAWAAVLTLYALNIRPIDAFRRDLGRRKAHRDRFLKLAEQIDTAHREQAPEQFWSNYRNHFCLVVEDYCKRLKERKIPHEQLALAKTVTDSNGVEVIILALRSAAKKLDSVWMRLPIIMGEG